jgi:peptide deformylase
MTLEILKYPNDYLDRPCASVEKIDEALIKIIHEMFDIMYDNNGIGLAANQVGLDKSLFVFDCSDEADNPRCLINPIVKSANGDSLHQEGCLSFPGIDLIVSRSNVVVVEYSDINDKQMKTIFKDLEAICVQHEIDHLNGITFLNRVNRNIRRNAIRTLRKRR